MIGKTKESEIILKCEKPKCSGVKTRLWRNIREDYESKVANKLNDEKSDSRMSSF